MSGSGACGHLLSVLVFLLVELVLLMLTLPAYIKHRLTLHFYGQSGDILAQPLDAGFLTQKVKTTMVSWMVELRGNLQLTELQAHLLAKCAEHREVLDKFRRMPVVEYGSTIWRKVPTFQIEEHVKEYPAKAENEDHLKRILQENIIPEFPSHSSPWLILLIHTSEGNTALLVVIHHSIIDGVGSMNLFNQILVDVPGTIPQRRTLQKSALLFRIWTWATKLLEYREILQGESIHSMKFEKAKPVDTRQLAWTKSISISQLCCARKELGETINNIVGGVIWRAISQYMSTNGFQTADSRLRVEIPASLRESSDFTPCNNFGSIFVEISPGKNLSTKEAINCFSKAINPIKSSFPSLFSHIWLKMVYITSVNQAMMARLMKTWENNMCSMSNIAGPDQQVGLATKDVRRMILFPAALGKSGLAFGISSYNGELTVSIFDYPGVLDTERMMKLVDEALQDLVA